ncbi:MAG: hypothetical protein COW65_05170 [Cytophagales bacterium CG18_big_fil_WC_8_21_14_2_50_42_9]|nr:MAG: hypothetical protein COW65_05170 [Cytophagales bacterium CG18_big_fil_WC_8_21_14_2_50_42_9]
MLNKEYLLNDYNSLVLSIHKCILRKDFEKALQLIDLAAKLAYQYNFLPTFTDPQLEDYINTITKLNHEEVVISGLENKIIFYDYFGYDNRGLTQQYLRALMQLEKEIVYILEVPNQYYSSTDIFNELQAYPKSKIYTLTETSNLGKIKEVIEILKYEKPSKAFLHLAPWDVVACTAFNVTKGIQRFQINLTDHAFWLGSNITDINLEFRSFGYNLSIQGRGMDNSKLKILPYYPIVNQHPFKGLPAQTKGKKIIFSGGSIYKILGEELLFLQSIKELLSIDPDLVFVFAGSGSTDTIIKFIEKNSLENRFFLIGDRKDISSVLQNVDYYLTTFPFTGALMSQIAAATATPIFFFSKPDYQCNDLRDLYFKIPKLESFEIVDDLIKGFKAAYKNKAYLNNYGLALQESMITPNEFAEGLNQIIEGKNPYSYLQQSLVVKTHQKLFYNYLIESENSYNPQYKNIVLNYLSTAHERKTFLPSFYKREQAKNWEIDKIRFLKNWIRLIFPARHKLM